MIKKRILTILLMIAILLSLGGCFKEKHSEDKCDNNKVCSIFKNKYIK